MGGLAMDDFRMQGVPRNPAARALARVLARVLALGAVLLPGAPAGAAGDVDVVTLRNGEIFNGTVAVEEVSIRTPYGQVDLPYGRVAWLRTGDGEDPDRVGTVEGETFSGRLRGDAYTVLRIFDPTLPVALADIAEIAFARRALRPRLAPAPDVVEMRNGDRFRAQVLTGDLMVRGAAGVSLVGRGGVHTVDIDVVEDDRAVRVQVNYNTPGTAVQGEMMGLSLDLRLRHGQDLSVHAKEVLSLSLAVLDPARPMDRLPWDLRGLTRPARLLRDSFADGAPGPEMAVLRGGAFSMGDLGGDGDVDERPVTRVVLARPFAMALYPVTFVEFDRFCRETGRSLPDDSGWGRGLRPVINVTWKDATDYAAWLSEKLGHAYRLPTDAEWEFAARAGTATRFWWGDEPGRGRANCSECGALWSGEKTARVGLFPANPFGLFDMAGNVWQWIADCYHASMAGAPEDGSARQKAAGCGKRVIRGGAWSFPAKEMRTANKWRDFPSRSSDDTGFRLVRDLD